MKPFRLDGVISVVTGAGRGLGRAQALALAEAGSRVVSADVDLDAATQTADMIRSRGGAADPLLLDVSDVAQVQATFEELRSRHGTVRVLVNNAGVSRRAPALDAPVSHFDEVVAVNMKGLYFTAQAAARQMAVDGGGSIVNLASIGGQVVDGERSSIYDATKAAVIQMTKNMAYEWGRHRIRVNAIAPGYMRTDMTAEFLTSGEAERAVIDAHIPLGRVGESEDLAGPVVFLASEASGFVTGHTLNVDGGWVIS